MQLVEDGHCWSVAQKAHATFCLSGSSFPKTRDSGPADVQGGCGDGVVHLDHVAALWPLLWQAATDYYIHTHAAAATFVDLPIVLHFLLPPGTIQVWIFSQKQTFLSMWKYNPYSHL